MDTIVEITLAAQKSPEVTNTFNRVDSLLKDWEERFSQHHPRSEVRAINQRTSQTLRISPQLAEMIDAALRYGELLQGDFDLTILPIKELWGLGKEADDLDIPHPDSLISSVRRVDFRALRVIKDSLFFSRPDIQIDMGGVAKGYALREISRLLEAKGISDYLIAAGDVLSKGTRADGRPWRVGIRHPRRDDHLLAIALMDSASIFTSGDYERFWEKDGKRYHHIFDPRTGQSCTATQSLTIWSTDPIEAKFLSTGLFCRGADGILEFLQSRPHLRCVIVDSTGTVHVSPNWGDELQLQSREN